MSNTAMTMPDRIWAWPWEPSPNRGQWQMADDRSSLDTPYIRADIAEELARALEVAQVWLNYDGRYDMQGINAILARYRALTP